MNIGGPVMIALRPIYSSVTWLPNEYMGPAKVKLDGPYIYRLLAQTDEYNFIFINFRTDRYNLNIFIGTDEFKKPDE
jgi:hypothetical protein